MRNLLIPLLLCLVLAACRKDDRDRDQAALLDFTIGKTMFDDAFQIMDEIADETDGIRSTPDCVESIEVDTLSSPMSIRIDFGNSTCTDILGTRRQGVLMVTFSGRYRDVGSQITIQAENYQVNDYILNGTQNITNLGLNSGQVPHFNVNTVNATVRRESNDYAIKWDASMVRTWVTGSESIFLEDDEYSVSGNAEGIDRNGNAYDLSVIRPVVFSFVCPWIHSGKISLTPSGKNVRFLDYGNGQCDNDATIEIDGFTSSVSI